MTLWHLLECILLLLILLLLFPNLIIPIRLLTGMYASPNEWSIRFTSRSLPIPTTSGSYLLKRYRPQEFPELEILNISSMAFRDNGNGPSKLLIIGAIILNFPYIMGTLLSGTISWRRLHLRENKDNCPPSPLWPGSYRNHCRLLRHPGTWQPMENGGAHELHRGDPSSAAIFTLNF